MSLNLDSASVLCPECGAPLTIASVHRDDRGRRISARLTCTCGRAWRYGASLCLDMASVPPVWAKAQEVLA